MFIHKSRALYWLMSGIMEYKETKKGGGYLVIKQLSAFICNY